MCMEREVLYGGAAGGGKSVAGLMAALQFVCVPGYSALLIRQTFQQLSGEKGLIDMALKWLAPQLDAGTVRWNAGRKRLTFPSNATVTFGYLRNDQDRYQYQGLAFQYVYLDELTHWPTSSNYRYVGFSRVRREAPICATCAQPMSRAHPGAPWEHLYDDDDQTCDRPQVIGDTIPKACPGCGYTAADVPLRTRAGSNPGGLGHAWVARRWNLDEYVYGGPMPTLPAGRVFIPASLPDNPMLDRRSYLEGLDELEPLERQRLAAGDWRAKEPGRMFRREWIEGTAT